MFRWLRKKIPAAATSTGDSSDQQISTTPKPSEVIGPLKLYHAGRRGDADVAAGAALSLDPNDIEGLLIKGMLAADKGFKAEALRMLSRAVDLEPNRADVRVAIGRAYALAGRSQDAREVAPQF